MPAEPNNDDPWEILREVINEAWREDLVELTQDAELRFQLSLHDALLVLGDQYDNDREARSHGPSTR